MTYYNYTNDNIGTINDILEKWALEQKPDSVLWPDETLVTFFLDNGKKLRYGEFLSINVSNFDPVEIELSIVDIDQIPDDCKTVDTYGNVYENRCEMFVFQSKDGLTKFELPFIFEKEYIENSDDGEPQSSISELKKKKKTADDVLYIGSCYADHFKYCLIDVGLVDYYEVTQKQFNQMRVK